MRTPLLQVLLFEFSSRHKRESLFIIGRPSLPRQCQVLPIARRSSSLALLVVMLAAFGCGGGGSSASPPPGPPTTVLITVTPPDGPNQSCPKKVLGNTVCTVSNRLESSGILGGMTSRYESVTYAVPNRNEPANDNRQDCGYD
jgi:hypothetical protein